MFNDPIWCNKFACYLDIFNRWLHWIRVDLCNTTIDMVFILKFWNLPFERFGSSPNIDVWLYLMTCFGCLWAVARVVTRKKFRVLGISGFIHWIWSFLIQVKFFNGKTSFWWYDPVHSLNTPMVVAVFICWTVMTFLFSYLGPLLPNIKLTSLLKLSQILHDFVSIKCTYVHHYVSLIYKMSAQNAVCRLVSGSK